MCVIVPMEREEQYSNSGACATDDAKRDPRVSISVIGEGLWTCRSRVGAQSAFRKEVQRSIRRPGREL